MNLYTAKLRVLIQTISLIPSWFCVEWIDPGILLYMRNSDVEVILIISRQKTKWDQLQPWQHIIFCACTCSLIRWISECWLVLKWCIQSRVRNSSVTVMRISECRKTQLLLCLLRRQMLPSLVWGGFPSLHLRWIISWSGFAVEKQWHTT